MKDFFAACAVIGGIVLSVLVWLVSALAIPALCITIIWWLLKHS